MSPDRAGSKVGAAKLLLLRAWRERWSDVQWGIQIKSVLPKDYVESSDLAAVMLNQALLGPAPNSLILGYLRHLLASRVITPAAALTAASKFASWEQPHCSAAVLDLVASCVGRPASMAAAANSKPEELVVLASSLLAALMWLLKLMSQSFEALELHHRSGEGSAAHSSNYRRALNLAHQLLEGDFSLALLYVGRAEDREIHSRAFSQCKQLEEQVKQSGHVLSGGGGSSGGSGSASGGTGGGVGGGGDASALKQELSRLTMAVKTIDPVKASGGGPGGGNDPLDCMHQLQPMLTFEALLRPDSDLTELAQRMAFSLGLKFSELVFQILRCSILSLSQNLSPDALKLDAFLLVRLPTLLEKLAAHMPVETLKAPTDMYKAFDKLLRDEQLLNSVDLRCLCNIVELLLRVVGKTSQPLMTATEAEDVLKRRNAKREKLVSSDHVPEEILGPTRVLEHTLKAEAMMDSVLEHLDTDGTKPEAMENLLGVLCQIIKSESFDLFLAASSANGRLKPFVKSMIKFNQQSQESQGESVKNSLLRAALFDITFLMLIHTIHSFGKEVVLREARDTLIETWVRTMLSEDGGAKQLQLQEQQQSNSSSENTMVDTLLQQLSHGELRTQVVKWQNVCTSIHLAMRELLRARGAGAVTADSYTAMSKVVCSKLYSLPVCVVTWMLGDPRSNRHLTEEFIKIAASKKEESGNSEMQFLKERADLMCTILRELEVRAGLKRRRLYNPALADLLSSDDSDSTLRISLTKVWSHLRATGILELDAVWVLQDLHRAGGTIWFVSSLVEELLSLVYQEELDKMSDLLTAVLSIDLEECTLALLTEVLPSLVLAKGERLTDPHGSAMAKIAVTCVYNVLIPHHLASNSGLHKKRSAEHDDGPSSKMRRLTSGNVEETKVVEEFIPHPVAVVTADFLGMLQRVSQESLVSPCTVFAVRFLEQAIAKRGRSKSRLILQHLSLHMVLHLVKVVPEMFTTAFVTQLFDVSSSVGRKSIARVLCLWKSVCAKREISLELDLGQKATAVSS